MNLENDIAFRKDIKKAEDIISYSAKEYERIWKIINISYKNIYICRIYVGSIGEFICRYLMIKDDLEQDDNNLYVFLPYLSVRKEISNKNLLDLMGQEIVVINNSNWGFWKYVVRKHYKELDLSLYKKYDVRRDTYYKVQKENALLKISNVQKKIGMAVAKRIGICGEYVCFHNRDEKYNTLTLGNDFVDFVGRNNSFENYSESIRYLCGQSIRTVRMGKYAKHCNCNVKFINFAEKYYCDFMDIYLLAGCKFYVGPNSGINMVAKAFAKPIVIVNSVYITVGAGSDINMDENLIILKKYFNRRTGKYLSLKAIAGYEKRFGDNTSQYEKRGIVIIENTPQEILDVVIEMNERLDGTWIETEEERHLQEEYMKILKELNNMNQGRFWNGRGTLCRIGSKFLSENRYLLE